MSNINFLCEIGTEEIPAGYIPPAIAAAEKIMKEKLVESRVHFDEIRILATPRRLAILISNLADSQKAEEIEIKGPAKKAAYDQNDNPTKALEGFIKGNNITFEDIYTVDTEKGEYIFAKKNLKSQPTKDILPDIITNIVNGMPFPKKMRWADKAIQFPRPIAYFLIIFNNETITFNIEGIRSSNLTRGHYIQNNHMIEITDINTYEETLLNNNVIVDQNKRKEMIINDLRKAAELAGGSLIEDEELLDIVTYLVEFPNIVTCMFDENFLNIPDIALIAEMREHQKYFSIRNKNGSLSNLFLVTSNNPETPFIKEGNERVVSARFNDAKFFYDEDRKKSLADRVEGLKNVLFHKELIF